jgi:mannosyltransferase
VNTSAATVPAAALGTGEKQHARVRSRILWAVAGVTAAGVALRFGSLGIQSYHHDEVITVWRVIPGSFGHMLHEVRVSESNPPLYYLLAWAWAKAFGTGEFGARSLCALFGAATIPVGYLIGRELAGARAGLIAAALIAVNPMLIWYSQEARSYAVLIFFGALALFFFARALRTRGGRDLALWALTSVLALCSHYFAGFAIAIEAVWLLVALRSRWRLVVPAVAGVAAAGAALLPLLISQINSQHIGWIHESPLSRRLYESGVGFLIGETGSVIAEPTRYRYALVPVIVVGLALLLVLLRGGLRERRGAAIGAALGSAIVLAALAAALFGKDYIISRNLLPALVPLTIAVALGFSASGARRLGAFLALALCAYWVAFDLRVTETANLQRPDFRELSEKLGPPVGPRAIVGWRLAADPLLYYLDHGAQRIYSGDAPVREIDVVSKPYLGRTLVGLPHVFRPVEQIRLGRLTLTRYMSPRLREVPYYRIHNLGTGFGSNAVIVDGLLGSAEVRR